MIYTNLKLSTTNYILLLFYYLVLYLRRYKL